VLVLDNEEGGLPQGTLEACEEIVTIPGAGLVQSLNVAASAAILLYALVNPIYALKRDIASLQVLLAPAGTGPAHIICFGPIDLALLPHQVAKPIHDALQGMGSRGGQNRCERGSLLCHVEHSLCPELDRPAIKIPDDPSEIVINGK
jgi:hypothetical protein